MPKLPQVTGHTEQLNALRADIESGNVSHAYLFSGARHLGKFSVALHMANHLLSVGHSESELPNIQSNVERLTHPDLLVLDQLWIEDVCEDWDVIARSSNVPQVHRAKKPSAKTDVISIDDIRALQERLHETGMGKYRCCLIRSVERMQDAAANAFLKILEEPPEGLIFLLTTEAFALLPPTTVSRTRVLNFYAVTPKEIRTLLADAPEDDRKFITHIACGAPGMATMLRDDPDLLRLHRTLHGAAQAYWRSHSLKERLQILSPIHKRGEEADNLLLHLGLALREQPQKFLSTYTAPFCALLRDLRTNAHRQLLTQRFALTTHAE